MIAQINMAQNKYRDEPFVNKIQWKEVLLNNKVTYELDIKTLMVVYSSPHNRATATNIAQILGQSNYHIISNGNASFSRRICKYLSIEPPKNRKGGNRWWTIPYLGASKGDGKWFFILRPELKEAIEELVSEGKIHWNSPAMPISKAEEILNIEDYYKEFNLAIVQSRRLTKEARMKRLAHANRTPVQTKIVQIIYKRNPDVVAEVLERAAGRCEACGNMAPFFRQSDDSPYLEVHHIIALSEGGEDTLENTIAVCPNCHRRYHYGQPVSKLPAPNP